MKAKIKQYMALEKKIHEYFGYKEDWVTIPIQALLDSYWFVTGEGHGDHYCHSSLPFSEALVTKGTDIFGGKIYTQRFLRKWVYRTDDLTMVCADTQCDGNKYLLIFDNEKECKDQSIVQAYNNAFGKGLERRMLDKERQLLP